MTTKTAHPVGTAPTAPAPRTAPAASAAHRPVEASEGAASGQMRAIVQEGYGSADVLRLGTVARPTIGAAEVLVEVRAAGLDRGTWHLMAGLPLAVRTASGLRAPKRTVPGLDVAGIVVAVGSKVTRFQPGDEVFGISKGAFAEYAAAREDKLSIKPANLTCAQAAAMPVSGVTALRGLCDAGRIEAGQRVLITGASGGVGTHAVQIAKALGATVTGVCSTGKVDLVRAIGADHVVDYTREDFTDGDARYDLILDIAGSTPLKRLRRALTPTGTLVIVGGEGGGRWFGGFDRQLRAVALSLFVKQRLTMLVPSEHHAGLDRLAELVVRDQVVPVIERTYPLADVPEAMRHLAGGLARGKLVVAL